jgi:hypothetical protein
MSGLIVVALLAAVACLAARYGADSRDQSGWGGRPALGTARRATPGADLRALGRLLGRVGSRIGYEWRELRRAHEALLRVQQPWLFERERGELRWRRHGRKWQLEGCMLPSEDCPER